MLVVLAIIISIITGIICIVKFFSGKENSKQEIHVEEQISVPEKPKTSPIKRIQTEEDIDMPNSDVNIPEIG